MRLKLLWGCSILLVAGPGFGCATIGPAQQPTSSRLVKEEPEEIQLDSFVLAAPKVEGTTLTLQASYVCNSGSARTYDRTYELENKTPTTTWIYAGAGIATLGAGTVLLVDSANVAPKDDASRTYNDVGQTNAVVYGSALAVAGVALTTIAVIDAISASAEVVRQETTRDGYEKRPCAKFPLVDAPVSAQLPGGKSDNAYKLGTTDMYGVLAVDLDTVIPSHHPWKVKNLEVYVQGKASGVIDLSNLLVQREDKAWQELNLDNCRNPRYSVSCEHISDFLEEHPGGPHEMEAQAVLDQARPAINRVFDEELWSVATSDALPCINLDFKTSETGFKACSGIAQYVKQRPGSQRRKEAEGILKKAEERIAALQKQEAATDKREAVQEQAEERKQCIGRCRVNCSGRHTDDKAGCLLGCIDANCPGAAP